MILEIWPIGMYGKNHLNMGNRNVWEKSFENEGLCIRESFKKRIPKQERIKVCSRGKVR